MNKNFYADSLGKTSCIVCEREIPDGNWFARVRFGDGRVAFCRPFCMEKFLENQGTYAAKLGLTWLAEEP